MRRSCLFRQIYMVRHTAKTDKKKGGKWRMKMARVGERGKAHGGEGSGTGGWLHDRDWCGRKRSKTLSNKATREPKTLSLYTSLSRSKISCCVRAVCKE